MNECYGVNVLHNLSGVYYQVIMEFNRTNIVEDIKIVLHKRIVEFINYNIVSYSVSILRVIEVGIHSFKIVVDDLFV